MLNIMHASASSLADFRVRARYYAIFEAFDLRGSLENSGSTTEIGHRVTISGG